MLQRRAVIDYALARRATLADVARGAVSRQEICDAHPDLLRAARHHGEPTGEQCPVCSGLPKSGLPNSAVSQRRLPGREVAVPGSPALRTPAPRTPDPGNRPLVQVTYVFGAELREATGRARAQAELEALAREHADLRVYVVEVCRTCSWNHLSSSFSIGTRDPVASTTRAGRRRAAGK